MPVRLPSYVYRKRCGIFYFRVVLPLALATPGDQREFRISLHTAERTYAIRAARYLACCVAELFALNLEMAKPRTRTKAPATTVSEQLKSLLTEARKKYAAMERTEELETELENERKVYKQAIATQLDKARSVVKQAYAQGVLRGLAQNPTSTTPRPAGSPLISQVIEDYKRFKAAKEEWTEKTREENLAALNLFVRIVGDMAIADVTEDTMMGYVETLKKLPPNVTKRFRGMSLDEILATNPEPTSTRTFNKKVERVSSLFKWAQSKPKYRLTHNPAAGAQARLERRGLWYDADPAPPWEWRAAKRAK